MKSLLFEDTLLLGLLLAFALAVLLGVWNRSRSDASRKVLWIGIIAAAGLLTLQAWVRTDRERLIDTVERLSGWVEARDIARIVSLFDPAAQFGAGRTLGDFREHLEMLLEKYDVQQPGVGGFEIELRSASAEVRCRAHCRVELPQGNFPVRSQWRLNFRLQGRDWRIVDLQPISIMDRQYGSFFDIN